ncbi:hypothetical protein [Cellulosimicrobium protaetiae]
MSLSAVPRARRVRHVPTEGRQPLGLPVRRPGGIAGVSGLVDHAARRPA